MTKTYQALNGVEVAKLIARKATDLALSIPGMNSRLTTFPRVKVRITVQVEAFDRAAASAESMDEYIEQLFADNPEQLSDTPQYGGFYAVIDESRQTPDAMRREAGIAVTRPQIVETTGQIVDVPVDPDPLPAGESFDNVRQFGMPGAPLADGTTYSGRGRVIEQESVSATGGNPLRDKLKGPEAGHFRIRPAK